MAAMALQARDVEMKIVIILDWFLYYSVELANALASKHDVLLVTRDHNFEISSAEEPVTLDDFLDNVLNPKVQRLKLRFRRGALRNFAEVPSVLWKIKKFNPDIIHVQETTDWRILLIAKMFPRVKRILTVHDVIPHPGERKKIYLNTISKMLRQSVAKIIVHGKYLQELMRQHYPKLDASIHILPHGVLSTYAQWDNADIVEEEMTILFFGRLTKYKGLDILLDAHRLVLKILPHAKLIIAGKGDSVFIEAIPIMQRQHLEIHSRFIPNSEVARLFRRSALVVLPYTEASQSGVIPIAYLFGKPVVATSVGSIPEIVKDGISGIIVPPKNPESLADAIIKVLCDDIFRKKLGENGKKIAEENLSWHLIAEKTEEIYWNQYQ
jgi:glycosyltransferase involved in cell wall biosynthesis